MKMIMSWQTLDPTWKKIVKFLLTLVILVFLNELIVKPIQKIIDPASGIPPIEEFNEKPLMLQTVSHLTILLPGQESFIKSNEPAENSVLNNAFRKNDNYFFNDKEQGLYIVYSDYQMNQEDTEYDLRTGMDLGGQRLMKSLGMTLIKTKFSNRNNYTLEESWYQRELKGYQMKTIGTCTGPYINIVFTISPDKFKRTQDSIINSIIFSFD